MDAIIRRAAHVTPTPRQLAWQRLEFTAFIHYTVNAFTDREWGEGDEDPAVFNPTELDTGQWVRVCKDAGMRMIILTAKHHDGFCLWPSAYTEHSVKNAPWRDGKGDLVRELSDACRDAGLQFGVYLSPWDRHEPTYGDSPKYNEHFRNQLRELLTNYGEIGEVWFDGACGEGPNGKRQEYDFPSYYRLIRELQPNAVIAIAGPDVRWVGNESGFGRETEWSVVPVNTLDPGAVAAASATTEDFFSGSLDSQLPDLGSREVIRDAKRLAWYPAEVDVSIRPGWFYHAHEDDKVKTPEQLVDIYYKSVGRNCGLLLNLPPDRRGLIHENDVAALQGMRAILDATFETNLAVNARINTSDARGDGFGPENLVDDNPETCWSTHDDVTEAVLMIDLGDRPTFNRLLVQEHIQTGQRVESFALEARDQGVWREVAQGTTIGYKRILRFDDVTARHVRLRIKQSRLSPALSVLGLYRAPK